MDWSKNYYAHIAKTFLTVTVSRFSHTVVSDSFWPHGLQHTRLPCPSPTPEACSNSSPSRQWCHPTISSVIPFSSWLQSFPASGSFPMSQLFTSSGQRIGVSASASVLPVSTQDWIFRTHCSMQTLTLRAHSGLGWVFSPQPFSESGLFKNVLFFFTEVSLQCCVSFGCIAKGFGYTFTHIHPFLGSFPV